VKFVVVSFLTSATPAALQPSPAVLDSMVLAWMQQIQDDFAPAYGAPSCSFRVASSPTDRQADEIGINLRDTLPDAPGALAYHATTGGVPDIEVACSLFESLYDAGESLSAGISHELLELLGDVGANQWADKQDGSGLTEARETADPVQNTGYAKANGVWVSNFVLPSYFVPGAPGPWDFMGVMTSAEDISHGYAIRATAPTDASQVQGGTMMLDARAQMHSILGGGKQAYGAGNLSELALRRKRSPWGRAARRGVRL
jgi:hypothetical protein